MLPLLYFLAIQYRQLDKKTNLLTSMTLERGSQSIKELPRDVSNLIISRKLIISHFWNGLQSSWPTWSTLAFKKATQLINKMINVNDCADRGMAPIRSFNTSTKDTIHKQYLLKYPLHFVEQHWKLFTEGNREELLQI